MCSADAAHCNSVRGKLAERQSIGFDFVRVELGVGVVIIGDVNAD